MFGITRAPEFDRAGLIWFNTPHPLTLAALRGRLLVLDFWTFCCINCMHVLPILRRLEETYPNEIVVIGVHSPKFAAERDPDKLAQALQRYDIRHPVVHDPHMVLWHDYAVRAWPTLVLVSPDGYVIGQIPGEPHPDMLLDGIAEMLREFSARGDLLPGRLLQGAAAGPDGRFAFPGKIKPAGPGLWAVADAGHHQIVLLDDTGTEMRRWGTGREGFDDVSFNAPQGLCCTAEAIYVADTGNHALRRIERTSGTITTLAGLGTRGMALKRAVPGSRCALTSPWDVAIADHRLYFANAGTHQLGVLDLVDGRVAPLAGNGGEGLSDGPAATALLAQPSGLAVGGGALYFVDSETSAVRALDLARGEVSTLIGRGLFDFGHADGDFAHALLQHPLGVAVGDGRLFVADSYNDLVRVIDQERRRIDDLVLSCADDLCVPLSEPAGVCWAGPGRLLVSDTNNHRILELDLGSRTYRTWAA